MSKPVVTIYLADEPTKNLAAFELEVNGKTFMRCQLTIEGVTDPVQLQAAAMVAVAELAPAHGVPEPTAIVSECSVILDTLRAKYPESLDTRLVDMSKLPEGQRVH